MFIDSFAYHLLFLAQMESFITLEPNKIGRTISLTTRLLSCQAFSTGAAVPDWGHAPFLESHHQLGYRNKCPSTKRQLHRSLFNDKPISNVWCSEQRLQVLFGNCHLQIDLRTAWLPVLVTQTTAKSNGVVCQALESPSSFCPEVWYWNLAQALQAWEWLITKRLAVLAGNASDFLYLCPVSHHSAS